VFAYLMDQGTGKTKVLLDDAAHNFREGRIDAVMIVSPNSVKTNWVNTETDDDEVNKHMAPDIPYVAAAHFANPNGEQKKDFEFFWKHMPRRDYMLVLSLNVEGIWTAKSLALAKEFMRRRKVMLIVDESTRIGNHTSQRTKAMFILRKLAPLARIASGTPVIKSPLKAYAQFGFLDPNILGVPTYTEFRARYAVMNPNLPNVPVRFVNTEELGEKIAGVSYRILKEACLDLPPKVYQKRMIQMAGEQAKWYKKMRDDCVVWLSQQHNVQATTVLTQLLRFQQITAGYLPLIDPDTMEQTGIKKIGEGSPPKVEEAISIIEETDGKVIIWCRFKFEIEEMRDACKKAGLEAVTFYGETSESDRLQHRARFQDDPSLRVFIGQVRTGGIGLTLHAASTVIYLSNTFSTEDRVQSEDRAHRIGQTKSVNYYDLVCPNTVDARVLQVLRDNKRVSDQVMRDGIQSWI
jgi:SNF2 family DNA or RNA helicase